MWHEQTVDDEYWRGYLSLPAMWEACRDKPAAPLSPAEFIAPTTDLWSSRTTQPDISLTVAQRLEAAQLLPRSFFPEDHTGENTASGLSPKIK